MTSRILFSYDACLMISAADDFQQHPVLGSGSFPENATEHFHKKQGSGLTHSLEVLCCVSDRISIS